MLGGPGEAVTAWSRAIPRAMVRRCCLPAPGSSRRQTLTPKSCALRVVRHTQLRQQRARVVHRHAGGPAAGRNQTVVLLYLLAAVVLRPPAGIRLGMWETTLPSSPPAPPTALTPARLGAAAVNIRYLACRACARAAQSVPSPPWAGINGVAQEVTAHAARIRGSASAVSHLPRKFGAAYGPGARCQRVKS